ncbi:MAG: MFS transporter [Haloarculaceae archaeon]
MTEQGGWRTIAVVTGWQLAASLCYYAPFAATPFLRDGFGLSRALVGVVVTALTLGYTVALFPAGALVDGFGERRVLLAALVALAAGAVAVTVAPTYPLLLAAAALLGAAYAPAMPGTNRALVRRIAERRRGLAMGVKQVGVTAGSGLSALLVTGLAGVLTWRAGFHAVAAVAVVVTVLFAVGYRGDAGDGRLSRPDVGSLRANRAYLLLVAAGAFLGAGLFTTVGYAILYLTESAGAAVVAAGASLALAQAAGSTGRVVAGGLADRLAGRSAVPAHAPLAVLGGQAAVAGLLFAALALSDPPFAVAVAVFVGLGFTALGLTGVYYSALTDLVAPDEVGAATAGGQTALNAGALLAPPSFGALADALSYGAGWAALAACAAVAVVLLAGAWHAADRREAAF